MPKTRAIVLVGSLVLVLVAVLGWFVLLSPRLGTVGEIDAERVVVESANEVAQAQIVELVKMKDNIASAKVDADELTRRFPPTAEQAELFTLVKAAATDAGIKERNITTLTISVPTIGAVNGSVTLPSETAPTDATTAGAPPDPTQAAPVTQGQLGSMTVDATVAGNQQELVAFLHALENMGRAFLVTSISMGSGDMQNNSLTISGQMFLLPELVDPTAPIAQPGVETPDVETPVAP